MSVAQVSGQDVIDADPSGISRQTTKADRLQELEDEGRGFGEEDDLGTDPDDRAYDSSGLPTDDAARVRTREGKRAYGSADVNNTALCLSSQAWTALMT